MMEPVSKEALSSARAYEELLVPALTREWAGPVVEAASVGEGRSVVDVACGTGVVAREALQRVGPTGRVVGVDIDPGMLAVAREIEPSIEWRSSPAEALPLSDGSMDAVVSQFGLMFFPDQIAAAREMLRVLRVGGGIAVAVWDSLENQPAYQTEVDLLDALAGREAGDAVRAPFALGDPGEALAIFEEAGFHDVRVSTRKGTGRFPDIRTMVGADLHGWLPIVGVHLDGSVIEEVLDAAETELAPFVVEGEVVFETSSHLITAKKS